jgi:hypothetical protein
MYPPSPEYLSTMTFLRSVRTPLSLTVVVTVTGMSFMPVQQPRMS